MNVQEALLNERIDPYLTPESLSLLGSRAVDDAVVARGARILTGGCWNRVVAIEIDDADFELVAKVSPHDHDPAIIREYHVLNEFARRSELPVPTPYHLDRGELIPGTTLVMSMVPGTVLHSATSRMSRSEIAGVSRQIADHLAKLHQIEGKGFGGVEKEVDELTSWPEFWLPRFDRLVEEASQSGVVERELLDGCSAIRPELDSFLEGVNRATMTHYDVWAGNVMVDRVDDDAIVTGFIDIPGYFADAARELSFAMMFGVADSHFFDHYCTFHELDAGFQARAALYNLKMHIKHIMMYPSERYYREGAAASLRTVGTAL